VALRLGVSTPASLEGSRALLPQRHALTSNREEPSYPAWLVVLVPLAVAANAGHLVFLTAPATLPLMYMSVSAHRQLNGHKSRGAGPRGLLARRSHGWTQPALTEELIVLRGLPYSAVNQFR